MNSALMRPAANIASLADRALVAAFLDKVPHLVHFKDRQSRFIAVSNSLVQYLGCDHARDVIGRTDADFGRGQLAKDALADEKEILRTGEPLLGKLEREVRRDGTVTWLITNRLPLRNDAGEIIGTFGLSKDVTQTKEIEAALNRAHKELVETSRSAGMAEVATGVLHNVGNVLNSLNVSASVLASGLKASKADSLTKLAGLLHDRRADLGTFLTQDPKGRRIPEFVASLARHAIDDRNRLLDEVTALQKNIDHIKEIVAMQQAYATMGGMVEPLDPVTLMEDSLRMNAGALTRGAIEVKREFQSVPPILGERSKVLQILVNLIRNAKHACVDSGAAEKFVTLRIEQSTHEGRVRFIVRDNGVGIPPENMQRMFSHGFTTRQNGHGFGLHSAANAARDMKGTLTVESEGRGRGATFTLELPIASPAAAVA